MLSTIPEIGSRAVDNVPLSDMLAEMGVAPESWQAAREALVEARVISGRPNRAGIAISKRDAVRATLEAAFLLHCRNGDCRRAAAGASATLLVEQFACSVCGGSADRRALGQMAQAMERAGLSRLLVVGGTEVKTRQIRANSPSWLECRFVDSVVARDTRYFRDHKRWAEVIAIWGGTPLPHKVSRHFDAKGDPRVVTVRGTGIATLAEAVRHHVQGSD